MRITILQGAFFPVPPLLLSGAEKVWQGLGAEFARRGHQVVHLSRSYPDLPSEEVLDGVLHRRILGFDAPSSKVLYRLLDLVYATNAIRHYPPADVLVTNSIWAPILIRSQRWGRLYVHVARFPKGQMRFYRHAARLQAVSSIVEAEILRELGPGNGSKVITIPPFLTNVSASDISCIPLEERPRSILYLGRIHKEKGVDILLKAFGRVSKEFPDWILRIVGPSDAAKGGSGPTYLQHLQSLCRDFDARVVWMGEVGQNKINTIYRGSRLFVYPSIAENGESFGMAPLEAMAMGCVALVSDLACFRDYLIPNVNGFTFNHRSNDPSASLAASLALIMKQESQHIAHAGLETSKRFRLEPVATQYLDDFARLA